MKKLAALLLSALMLLTLATGCGGNTSTPSDSQKEEQTPSTDNAGSDLVVGFSTGAAGTTFRQEGIDDFTKVAEEYKAEGRIKDYKIVNNTTNWDANEQANIIRDFINDDEINVIVVNPNSPTDLNGVLAEAVAAGMEMITPNVYTETRSAAATPASCLPLRVLCSLIPLSGCQLFWKCGSLQKSAARSDT